MPGDERKTCPLDQVREARPENFARERSSNTLRQSG
jgi:hypothetical protein